MKNEKSFLLNIKYFSIQVFYFGIYVALMGYASVYLLGKGFSNSTIGIVLAISSMLAVFTQPFVATFSDKHKNIELRKIVIAFLFFMLIMSISILLLKEGTIFLLCLFVGVASIHAIIMPLLNAMAFVFEKHGIEINYGIGRGLGSAAYAIVSLILGYLVKDFGINIFPIFYIIFNFFLILVVYVFVVPKNKIRDNKLEEKASIKKQLSFLDFCKRYKKFIIFVVGLIFVYFTVHLISNFFIQIITPIGGTEKEMGIAVFISAIMELPTMLFFNSLRKKINSVKLIIFAVIMFVLKHVLILFANSMIIVYVAQILQMFSYAILIPATVYYANQVIDKEDLVKGQSMITMAFTCGGIFASLIGGILLDTISIHYVLLVGVVSSIIGAIIVVLGVKNKEIV